MLFVCIPGISFAGSPLLNVSQYCIMFRLPSLVLVSIVRHRSIFACVVGVWGGYYYRELNAVNMGRIVHDVSVDNPAVSNPGQLYFSGGVKVCCVTVYVCVYQPH